MSGNVDTLRGLRVFGSLPEPALEWLAAHVSERTFPAGATLIEQGRIDRDCYFLVSGVVEVVQDGTTIARCGPGDPEGELALLYRGPRSATVTAASETTAYVLAAADFDDADPAVGAELSRALRAFLGERFGHPSARA